VLDGASFWASAARLKDDGHFHYRDVIGPDEYHEHVDDNAYTNYLAVWHLKAAASVLAWLRTHAPEKADELTASLGIDDAMTARWAEVAGKMLLPLDTASGLIEQFEGYFERTDADAALMRDPARTTSIQQLYGIDETNDTQVLKQPDVLMLQYLLPGLFTEAQLRANYAYYDPRTDHEHGSSLGPSISAVMACRAGQPELGYEHFLRAARADLLDVRHNAGDGIHGASAGGLWQATVFGFAGLVVTEDGYTTSPMLPASWTRLAFTFSHRGVRQHVVVER
jgi:trehalose/maltose hydrolase-like predicted phosphorylase